MHARDASLWEQNDVSAIDSGLGDGIHACFDFCVCIAQDRARLAFAIAKRLIHETSVHRCRSHCVQGAGRGLAVTPSF
jgi:hypothetical protein